MAILYNSPKSKHNPKVLCLFFVNKARTVHRDTLSQINSLCNNSSHRISTSSNSIWLYDMGIENCLSTKNLINLKINVSLGENSVDSFSDAIIFKFITYK